VSWARKAAVVALVLLMGFLAINFVGAPRLRLFNLEIGSVGAEGPNYMKYHYQYFRGEKSALIFCDDAQTLTLHYDIEIKSGYLLVKLLSPQGKLVWSKIFNESASGLVNIPVDSGGFFKLVIESPSTSGGFDLLWDVQ